MTNVRTIHVDWYSQRPPRFSGGPQLAYQGDHLSNMVVFDRAPELPNYYLLVEMKTDDAGPVVTLPEIRLEGPYWVIPNYYTQICQKITYQVCCKTESGDFEHHSAKFEGTILPVIKHNGEPIDQSPMFDPYINILDKRVSELILDADVKEIDSELKSDSGNPVQNRVIKAKIDEIDENAIALNGRLGQLDGTVYTTGQECELRKTVTGYALDTNGYRVTAEGYKLFSFRVAAGWLIKVASTHKFQFQTNQDVTASGTQYRIGPTYGEGEYVLTVPDEASFIVVSSASESETVYRAVSAITQAYNEVNAKAEDAQTKADYSVGNLRLVNNELFPYGDNLTVTSEMSGYALDANGYRITQEGNKLMRFRVFAGNVIKFACPDKCQFQSTDGVPATGTQYIIGSTYGIGEYVFEVPEGATYLIISTPSGNNVAVARVDHFVDETLSKEWKAADARQTGNGIEDTKTYLAEIGSYMYTNVRELASVKTLTGYALNDNGYRVIDENRKLESIRCFEGTYVKIVSDHMFQFQSSRDVTASGTQYKLGRTYGVGEYVLKVPEGSGYVILSTTIEDSNATVHEVTSNIDSAVAKIDETASSVESMKDDLIGPLLNTYTSQVSDVPYVGEPTVITIGIDTSVPQFISGAGKALVVPLIGGTSIRVAKPQTDHCLVCFTSDYPAANVAVTHYTSLTGKGNTSFVAESQASDKYLVIYTHATTPDIADYTLAFSQVARGTVELLPQLDEHMINLLKYRPVGKISKPYIAISCDDGLEPLATYTIPRIQYWNNYYNTNIPLHMALFDGSPVLTNPEYAALVKDMCDNHNCSIGIHGTQPYTVYSSSTALYAYMKKQRDTIIEKTGVTPTSVLYPHNAYTDQIMVMSGAFCGICAIGSGTPPAYKYVDNSGRYFYVGEKTNLYEVNRFNISDTRIGSVAELKNVIDYAYEHNYVICPYFHDIDFTEHTEAANQFARTMFDTLIQYGMEKGIEFINLGDIRFLT